MEALSWALGISIFIVVIGLSIALHEAGHMATARLLKVPVLRFFVGFGPTLWSKERSGVEYGVKAVPLGGFIDIQDTRQPEGSMERHLLSHVAPWKRQLIFVAGPMVNLVLGVAILFVFLMSTPQMVPGNQIAKVNSCSTTPDNCIAEKAGIRPGDRIVSVAGREVSKLDDFRRSFVSSGNNIVIERNGTRIPMTVPATEKGTIGINMTFTEENRTHAMAMGTIVGVFERNFFALAELPSKIPNLFYTVIGVEERATDSVSSIVGVGRVYGETAAATSIEDRDKVHMLITYSGLLNIGLGLVNLMPLMPLDGGRMLVAFMDSCRLAWSRVTRRRYTPTTYRFISALTGVTGVAVIGFMVLAIAADIVSPISVLG